METVIEPYSDIVAIKGYMQFERVVFVQTIYFRFRMLHTAQLISDILSKRQSGDKMFLSVITAPIYWRI
jgi:hypothetical protein